MWLLVINLGNGFYGREVQCMHAKMCSVQTIGPTKKHVEAAGLQVPIIIILVAVSVFRRKYSQSDTYLEAAALQVPVSHPPGGCFSVQTEGLTRR